MQLSFTATSYLSSSLWRQEIQRVMVQTDLKRRFRSSLMVACQPDVSDNAPDVF